MKPLTTRHVVQSLINKAHGTGMNAYLRLEPNNFLVLEVKDGESGQTQVLLSSFRGRFWETLKPSDKIFIA